MGSDRPTIDIEKQRFAVTLPRLAAIIVVVAASAVAYARLATEQYVDEKHSAVMDTVGELAEAQATTQDHISKLTEAQQAENKKLKLLVKLTAAQYLETVDENENRGARRQRQGRARSAEARKVAEALKMDPDDPLAGVELLSDAIDE